VRFLEEGPSYGSQEQGQENGGSPMHLKFSLCSVRGQVQLAIHQRKGKLSD
jgi:hypothetical protein